MASGRGLPPNNDDVIYNVPFTKDGTIPRANVGIILEKMRQEKLRQEQEQLELLDQQQRVDQQQQLRSLRQLEQKRLNDRQRQMEQQQELERQELAKQQLLCEQQQQEEERRLLEQQQKLLEHQQRLEHQRLQKLEQQRLEEERQKMLEQKRLEQERLQKLELQRLEEERLRRLELKRLEQQRIEEERLRMIELQRLERQRQEEERLRLLELQRMEQVRLRELEMQRLDQARLERLEQERLERLDRERMLELDQMRQQQRRQQMEEEKRQQLQLQLEQERHQRRDDIIRQQQLQQQQQQQKFFEEPMDNISLGFGQIPADSELRSPRVLALQQQSSRPPLLRSTSEVMVTPRSKKEEKKMKKQNKKERLKQEKEAKEEARRHKKEEKKVQKTLKKTGGRVNIPPPKQQARQPTEVKKKSPPTTPTATPTVPNYYTMQRSINGPPEGIYATTGRSRPPISASALSLQPEFYSGAASHQQPDFYSGSSSLLLSAGPAPTAMPPPPPMPPQLQDFNHDYGTLRNIGTVVRGTRSEAPIFLSQGSSSLDSSSVFYSAGEEDQSSYSDLAENPAGFEPAPDYSDDNSDEFEDVLPPKQPEGIYHTVRDDAMDNHAIYADPIEVMAGYQVRAPNAASAPPPPPPPPRTTPSLLLSQEPVKAVEGKAKTKSKKRSKKKRTKSKKTEEDQAWNSTYNTAGQLSARQALNKMEEQEPSRPLEDDMFMPPVDYGDDMSSGYNAPLPGGYNAPIPSMHRSSTMPAISNAPAPPPPPPPPPPPSGRGTITAASLQAELAKRQQRAATSTPTTAATIHPSKSAPSLAKKGPPPGANGFGDDLQNALKARLAQRNGAIPKSDSSSSDVSSVSSFNSDSAIQKKMVELHIQSSPERDRVKSPTPANNLIANSLRPKNKTPRPFFRTDSSSSFSSMSSASTGMTEATPAAAVAAAASSSSPPKKNPFQQMTQNRNFNLYGTLPRAKPEKKTSVEGIYFESPAQSEPVAQEHPAVDVVPIKLFGKDQKRANNKPTVAARPLSLYQQPGVRSSELQKPGLSPRPISIQGQKPGVKARPVSMFNGGIDSELTRTWESKQKQVLAGTLGRRGPMDSEA